MQVQVIKRRISPAQLERRAKIIDCARHMLAEQGGTISMEAVAEASGTSRSTLYRNFSSREHLVSEVTLDAGRRLVEQLRQHPPTGSNVGDRVSALCHHISNLASANTALISACVHNMSSQDPAVIDAQIDIEEMVTGFFTSVLGEQPFADKPDLEKIIFRYLLGAFLLGTSGKLEFGRIAQELTTLCQGLLGADWQRPVEPAA
jgi:AcrR family transcriptional regulator